MLKLGDYVEIIHDNMQCNREAVGCRGIIFCCTYADGEASDFDMYGKEHPGLNRALMPQSKEPTRCHQYVCKYDVKVL